MNLIKKKPLPVIPITNQKDLDRLMLQEEGMFYISSVGEVLVVDGVCIFNDEKSERYYRAIMMSLGEELKKAKEENEKKTVYLDMYHSYRMVFRVH